MIVELVFPIVSFKQRIKKAEHLVDMLSLVKLVVIWTLVVYVNKPCAVLALFLTVLNSQVARTLMSPSSSDGCGQCQIEKIRKPSQGFLQ